MVLTKIGDWIKRNQADIALVIGFILVALIAFGAGRLTAPETVKNPLVVEQPFPETVSQAGAGQGNRAENAQGQFVASRGGTKYHWPWCSYAEKIKDENKIWFNSEAEAQAAGYSPCACLQSKAPAGYGIK
ncbi:MAG: Ada metal-binding domain-containing protein [Candidatus Portnoybacteria bacterium]|nr:Ada metal-binding domain-containing protein [Candidatus Portnoybacteria bacterium]